MRFRTLISVKTVQTSSFLPLKLTTCEPMSICAHPAAVLNIYTSKCYTIEPFGLKLSRQIPTRIGCTYFCADSQQVFVSNLENGIDQYDFPHLNRQRTFKHAIVKNYILQIAAAGEGSWLISGGDSRFCCLFDRWNSELIAQLDHCEHHDHMC